MNMGMTRDDILSIAIAIVMVIYLAKLWLAGKEVQDKTDRALEIEAEARDTFRDIGESFRRMNNTLVYGHPDVRDADYEIIEEEDVAEDERRMLPM